MEKSSEILELIFSTDFFTEAFWVSIRDKVLSAGYIQIDNFYRHFSATERKNVLMKIGCPPIVSLLQKSLPNEDEFIEALKKVSNYSLSENILTNITAEIGTVIISWLLYCGKQRYAGILRKELSKWVASNKENIIYTDDKFIISKNVDYKIIDSLGQYINIILELTPQFHIFFRGQDSLNYWIQPSIRRSPQLCQNESKLYQELILRCPNDFSKCKSHLDYLVQMQHYGLPTRLIDITTNPLVALYFSSLGKSDKGSGEVVVFDVSDDILKYERSDTVSIISCLPLFNETEQKELLRLSYKNSILSFNLDETVSRLLHEIKIDKPAFSDRIIPSDIRKNLVVTPSLKNDRIVKQSGAFIICGLADSSDTKSQSLESLRYRTQKGNRLLLIIENKDKIKKQLNAFNINSAALFPEIDDVASFLRDNWL